MQSWLLSWLPVLHFFFGLFCYSKFSIWEVNFVARSSIRCVYSENNLSKSHASTSTKWFSMQIHSVLNCILIFFAYFIVFVLTFKYDALMCNECIKITLLKRQQNASLVIHWIQLDHLQYNIVEYYWNKIIYLFGDEFIRTSLTSLKRFILFRWKYYSIRVKTIKRNSQSQHSSPDCRCTQYSSPPALPCQWTIAIWFST